MTISDQFWAGVIGTLIGALVSGLISYLLQKSATKSERDRTLKESKDRQTSILYGLLSKLIRIHSNTGVLHRSVEEAYARAKEFGRPVPPWLILQPLANLPSQIEIVPDELSVLFTIKERKIFQDILMIDETYNGTIALFELQRSLRLELDSLMSQTVQGDLVRVEPPKSASDPRQIKIQSLNNLVGELRERCDRDLKESQRAIEALIEVLRKHFNFDGNAKFIHPLENQAGI